jgi:hypothetical protein
MKVAATNGYKSLSRMRHSPAFRPVGVAEGLRSFDLLWLRLLIWLLIFAPIGRPSEGVHPGQARSAVRRSRTHREEVQRSKP